MTGDIAQDATRAEEGTAVEAVEAISAPTHRPETQPAWNTIPYTFVCGVESKPPFRVYDLATCGELSARSLKGCAARSLARVLIAKGAQDGPIEARGEDGKLRYTVKSLFAFAKFSMTENPRPRLIRWTPHPHANDGEE
jgi:hypothetical protein